MYTVSTNSFCAIKDRVINIWGCVDPTCLNDQKMWASEVYKFKQKQNRFVKTYITSPNTVYPQDIVITYQNSVLKL